MTATTIRAAPSGILQHLARALIGLAALVASLGPAITRIPLFALRVRRGTTDPVCSMTVDRHKALRLADPRRTWFFCSEGFRDEFRGNPGAYGGEPAPPDERDRHDALVGAHGHDGADEA